MAKKHSELPAPCELHSGPTGISDDTNAAAAAATEEEAGVPADDTVMGGSKELEREYESKEQSLEHPAGMPEAPMAEDLDGVEEEEEYRQEQEQEDQQEEVPASTNSTEPVLPQSMLPCLTHPPPPSLDGDATEAQEMCILVRF